jgi:hypothetical protein
MAMEFGLPTLIYGDRSRLACASVPVPAYSQIVALRAACGDV